MQLIEQPREELDALVLLAHVEALLAAHRHFLHKLMRTDLFIHHTHNQ